MSIRLASDPDLLRTAFFSLQTPRGVASLLEIEYSRLVYHLHKTPLSKRYVTFSVPKKTGGVREVCAPATALKIIQRKLNQVLTQVYEARPSVNGFVAGRNIVRNAEAHAKRRFVLNVDLKDFFPSIHFGRVRGMFMAPPYKRNVEVATVLAQICCLPKAFPLGPPYAQLPQGAPTSPIVANMVCARLDRQLQRLARKHKCSYSRYADDLTFSTNLAKFPENLCKVVNEDGKVVIELGNALREIIEANKFSINGRKVRLQGSSERQTVTGLITNESPNLKRKFSRQIRAMLHAWKKHGYENAERVFHEKFCNTYRNPSKAKPSFSQVVKGKIDFLGMVRGKTDPLYICCLRKLRELDPTLVKGDLLDVTDALWVLECEAPYMQGTGFMLKGYGLVTCSHVLRPGTCAFRAEDPHKKFVLRL